MMFINQISDFKKVLGGMYNNNEVKYIRNVADAVEILKEKGYTVELDLKKDWKELHNFIQMNNSTMDDEMYKKFHIFMRKNVFDKKADVFYCRYPDFEEGADGAVIKIYDYAAWADKLVKGKVTLEMDIYAYSSKMYHGFKGGFSITGKEYTIYPTEFVEYNEETGEFQFSIGFKQVSPKEYYKLFDLMSDAHNQIDYITLGWYDNIPVEDIEEVNVSSRSSEREN